MMAVNVSGSAPVVEHADVVVNAPVETVWAVLSDFPNWPTWNRSVTRMEFAGPVAVGTTFRWVGGGTRITSRIEEVEPCRRLVWSGRTLGIRALHVWTFEERPDGTRVFTAESFEGLLAKVFSGLMRKTLSRALAEGLVALKAEAESRHRARGA